MKNIENVEVVSWCIWCRNCENICPKIFKVDKTSKVISNNYSWNETEILMAEKMCPVSVIKVAKKWNFTLKFNESKVLNKKYLNEKVLEIILEKNKDFSFKPWQYISIMFEDYIWKFSRQYSVAEVFSDSFSLTVNVSEKGRGASKLKKLKIWKKINFLWPIWNFYLQDNKKEKYFIATGTWLAPFIAMWQNCPHDVKKNFIIWNRKKSDFYYDEKLKNIPNSEIIYFTSKEKTENYNFWRVTDALKNIPKENSEIYICWNPLMVEDVLKYLYENNYDKNSIFSEDFKVSGKYEPLLKNIFINWNIPFLKEFSRWIIFLAFILSWIYLYKINFSELYREFLFFWKFQNFIFDISWFSVVFVMMIRPLSDIFSKSNFLRKLKNLRKPFGILSSILIIVNFAWKWIFDPSLAINYFTTLNRWNNVTALISRISEISAVLLFLTSNTFSQKFLWKWWKIIQYLSYPYFITWAISWAKYSEDLVSYLKYYWLFWLCLFLFVFAFILNKKRNI